MALLIREGSRSLFPFTRYVFASELITLGLGVRQSRLEENPIATRS